MPDNMMQYMMWSHNTAQNMEMMYPEVYDRLYPFILMTAHRFPDDMELTDDVLSSMTDDIILRSGIMTDMSNQMGQDGMTVQRNFGRNRFHNRDSIRDIARILLLRELIGRRRHIPYGFYPYNPYNPYFPF